MLVPVMDVGEMGVAMTQRGVHVPVRMRLPWRLATIMAVLVVLIMHMSMLVGHFFVAMFVFVALRQMKPDSNRHEQSGDSELDRHRFPQNEHGDQPAEERSQREVRPGPGRSNVPKGNNEEHQADTVTGKSDNHRGTQRAEWWQARTKPEGDANVYHSRHTSLQERYLDWVCLRDLARQIVIDGPGKTGAGNHQGAKNCTEDEASTPSQHESPDDDRRHSERDASVKVLSKYEPREKRSQYAFQVQQESRSRSSGMSEANHEQHRADNTTGEDRQRQPRPLTTPQSGLATRIGTKRAGEGSYGDQTKTRAEIEQPRQHPRIDITQKQLGKGCAGAEEKRRQNGEPDTRAERLHRHHGLLDRTTP